MSTSGRRDIPIGQCELDPRNPRIQYLVGLQGGNVTQDELDNMIWSKDKVKMLAQGIRQNGRSVNLLHVRRVRHLRRPFSVARLIKTEDGESVSDQRTVPGGWTYVKSDGLKHLVQ